jgi:outer membrane immunogenic protein
MKKIILAGALALIAAPALAADLPRRSAAAAPAPIYAAPVFTWTGFYVGAQAGYGWGKDKYRVSLPSVATFKVSPDGVLGGVHAGYNWQSGSFVYGVEGDIEYANQRDKFSNSVFGAALAYKSNIGMSGSLRLRAGYAIDRTLLYVTAGLAGADIEQSVTTTAGVKTKNSGFEYGWTAGVGAEYAFTQNWSARLEYRYTDFGTSKWSGTVLSTASRAKFDTTDQTVRVGLSYRFGGAASPVMARY